MSIFKSIFKAASNNSVNKEINIYWIPLISLDQIEKLKEISKKDKVLIFKHSTRCYTSNIVLRQFEKSFYEEVKNLKTYYLDVLNYRQLSDEVSFTFQVLHESPQLLVIKKGVVVKHASHYNILELKY